MNIARYTAATSSSGADDWDYCIADESRWSYIFSARQGCSGISGCEVYLDAVIVHSCDVSNCGLASWCSGSRSFPFCCGFFDFFGGASWASFMLATAGGLFHWSTLAKGNPSRGFSTSTIRPISPLMLQDFCMSKYRCRFVYSAMLRKFIAFTPCRLDHRTKSLRCIGTPFGMMVLSTSRN